MVGMILQPIDGNGNTAGAPIIVPYAPPELSFSKSVQYGEVAIPGLNQPLAQFVRGDAETLTLELFFDSTISGMGDEAESVFTAIVLSVARKFTLFSPSGKPLRAVVTLALKQYATIDQQIRAMNLQSADHTRIHVVSEGETLPLIAHDAYDDAAAWRLIADFNKLEDVRDLMTGQRLELPPRDLP